MSQIQRFLKQRITLLPLNLLEVWRSGNVRTSNALLDIEDLAKNIQRNGLIVPLIVTKKPNSEQYWVISGQRRFEACNLIRYDPVECVVVDDVDLAEAKIISLSENIYRLEMDPDDVSEACSYLYETKFHTIASVAKHLGVSEETVRSYLRYKSVPEELKELVRQKKISKTQALKIYTKFPDHDRQIRMAKYLAGIAERNKRSKAYTAIKQASPKADVADVEKRATELEDMEKFEIYLDQSIAQPIRKEAENQEVEAPTIISEIVERWVERQRNRGLPILD